MSRTQSKVAPTKFCKVCKQAGKSEFEFTSHNTKSSASVVTCPTLWSQKCGWCSQFGHTPKYCKQLLEKNKKVSPVLQKNVTTPKIVTNKFAAFNDSDDEIDEKKAPEKKASYASMISKVMPEVPTVMLAPARRIYLTKPKWTADESSDDDEEPKFVQSHNTANSKLIRAEIGDECYTNGAICDWDSAYCVNSPII